MYIEKRFIVPISLVLLVIGLAALLVCLPALFKWVSVVIFIIAILIYGF